MNYEDFQISLEHKATLVSIVCESFEHHQTQALTDHSLNELAELLRTLGIEAGSKHIQKRAKLDPAMMLGIGKLEEIAQKNFLNLEINKIKLQSWNEKNAKIKFYGYLKDNRYISGRINRMHIELSAINGKVIDKKDLSNANVTNGILSTFYFLHFIRENHYC